MSYKSVSVNDRNFPAMSYAEEVARTILYAQPIGTVVTDPDAAFVLAMFNGRVGKVDELGDRSIIQFWRKTNRYGTRCFFAEVDDGTFLDFSYLDAIKDMANAQHS